MRTLVKIEGQQIKYNNFNKFLTILIGKMKKEKVKNSILLGIQFMTSFGCY